MSTFVNTVVNGDCLEKLKELESESIDLIVTDPPYGYSFMGKDWDKAVPSVDIWKECLRVLKPGAFAFIMSAPRQDVLSQMIVRVGEAGFDMDFTSMYWTYASGFPKAMNIGKAVDKRMGVEREFVSKNPNARPNSEANNEVYSGVVSHPDITKPSSEEAKALDGSYGGFQPKPAVEVIIVAMKPLSEKTFVDQALKNGKGITWLDDARIPSNVPPQSVKAHYSERVTTVTNNDTPEYNPDERGRFPANLLVSDDVLNDYTKFFSLDDWAKTLPFLICPKASKSEKNKGLEDFEEKITGDGRKITQPNTPQQRNINSPQKNHHPTVKPLKLMSYLITLGSRKGDTVLDPFAGSCTTGVAAKELGRNYICIERETEYVKICDARLLAVQPTLL